MLAPNRQNTTTEGAGVFRPLNTAPEKEGLQPRALVPPREDPMRRLTYLVAGHPTSRRDVGKRAVGAHYLSLVCWPSEA